jgi:hypothetical protein
MERHFLGFRQLGVDDAALLGFVLVAGDRLRYPRSSAFIRG